MSKYTEYKNNTLKNIIKSIDDGKYLVPNFQREFVWKKDMMVRFLNSILDDEPFGSIIIWEPNKTYNISTRNEIIKKLQKSDDGYQQSYIIDGQQRLTTLFSMLNNLRLKDLGNKNGSIIKTMKTALNCIYFDLREKIFVSKTKSQANKDNRLISIYDAIYSFDDPNGLRKNHEIDDNDKDILAEKVISKLSGLQVGVIELKGYNIDEVIAIFNNINTGGKKLTNFEIINAKWNGLDISLEDFFSKLSEDNDFAKFNDLSIIMDAFFICLSNELKLNRFLISSDDKLDFECIKYKERIIEFLPRFESIFKKTCSVLKNMHFNTKTLPSYMIIKWLSYAIYMIDELNDKQLSYIKKYIALISINGHYSNSTNDRLKDDLNFINEMLNEGNLNEYLKKYFSNNKLETDLVKDTESNMKSMLSKFITWVMECNFKAINNTPCFDLKDDFHTVNIFPNRKNENNRYYTKYPEIIDSICNFIVVDEKTKKIIDNKNPSKFNHQILKENNNDYSFFQKLFIDIKYLNDDNFEELINDRAEKITDFINNNFLNQ